MKRVQHTAAILGWALLLVALAILGRMAMHAFAGPLAGPGPSNPAAAITPARPILGGTEATTMTEKIKKTDAQWRAELTPEQYAVLREKATERPFTGAYEKTKDAGIYRCAGCGQLLFASDAKFDSGCGWPSYDAAQTGGVETARDVSHGMVRTEVLCARCGGHLGHLFDDGPTTSGLRYCINSAALKFEKK